MASFAGFGASSSGAQSVSLRSSDIDTKPTLRFVIADLIKLRGTLTREEIESEQLDDDTLARFLIARNSNVEKARLLLQDARAWRKSKIPIYKSCCLTEYNKGKVYAHGMDKEGHPLVVYRAKLQNPHDRDVDEMVNMAVWWAEKIISQLPADKSKATILIDRTDAGMANSDMEFVRAMASVFQNNYPERLHRAIVYPSGIVFYTIWNLVKWFLDPVTQDKVKPVLLLGGVQEFIDDEYIPDYMGGKCAYAFRPDDYSETYPPQPTPPDGKQPDPLATPPAAEVTATS